ncbi:MAG: glutamate--tRNA ligase family protein, partial [Candidatus Omnitrophota bacterium]
KKLVSGWNDPRMPTISGFRRRGYTPESIRRFCEQIGVSKTDSIIELSVLENSIREELNRTAPRVMAVLRPLKVIIDNYPEGQTEYFDAVNNPEDPSMGIRRVPFARELYIENDDFLEDPPKQYHRLTVGREVRLRYAYLIKCVGVVKDPGTGEIVELHCTYDPQTRNCNPPDGRKVKGTIHWVSAKDSVAARVRLYETLFVKRDPGEAPAGCDFTANLNPDSLTSLPDCRCEPSLAEAKPGQRFQFERLGYFYAAPEDAAVDRPVFSRIVTLRDTWAKIQSKL